MPISLRSVAAAIPVSIAFCATATAIHAQDGATTPRSYPVRATIGREAARLAEAGARRTTWQQPVLPERKWVDRHYVAAAALVTSAAGTTREQVVQQEGSWVGRHPALTGALIGAGVGATYAYVWCRGQCEGQPQLYMALFGGIGAGIGVAAGAIVGALRD